MELNIDVKGKIDDLAKKIQGDPKLLKSFQDNPIKTIEGLVGVDLPDDKLQPIVSGIQTKLAATKAAGALDGLKKLF